MGSYFITATLPLEGGTRLYGVQLCYRGAVEEGERLARPIRSFGRPVLDNIGRQTYMEVQSFAEIVNPAGHRNYWKSVFLKDLDARALDALRQFILEPPHPWCEVSIEQMGGAVSRVPNEATPVNSREARFNVLILGLWNDRADDSRCTEWVRNFAKAAEPYSIGDAYVNYVSADEAAANSARGAQSWGAEKYARLLALKNKYDPDNLFRLNQNIPPSTPARLRAQR